MKNGKLVYPHEFYFKGKLINEDFLTGNIDKHSEVYGWFDFFNEKNKVYYCFWEEDSGRKDEDIRGKQFDTVFGNVLKHKGKI